MNTFDFIKQVGAESNKTFMEGDLRGCTFVMHKCALRPCCDSSLIAI